MLACSQIKKKTILGQLVLRVICVCEAAGRELNIMSTLVLTRDCSCCLHSSSGKLRHLQKQQHMSYFTTFARSFSKVHKGQHSPLSAHSQE